MGVLAYNTKGNRRDDAGMPDRLSGSLREIAYRKTRRNIRGPAQSVVVKADKMSGFQGRYCPTLNTGDLR